MDRRARIVSGPYVFHQGDGRSWSSLLFAFLWQGCDVSWGTTSNHRRNRRCRRLLAVAWSAKGARQEANLRGMASAKSTYP